MAFGCEKFFYLFIFILNKIFLQIIILSSAQI